MLHKLFGTTRGKGVQPKEIISYSVAGLGQNLISGLITSFLLVFLTDGVGIPAMWCAWLMLGTRLFDAFNDPIMGSLVDKTKSRWGKLRPYLLFMPIPIALMTVLCFTSVGTTMTDKFVYSTVIYVVWSICYTIIDVPYWGLSSAMTSDTNKRNMLLTVARLFCTAGAGIVTVFLPIFQGMVQNKTFEKFPELISGGELTVGGLADVAKLRVDGKISQEVFDQISSQVGADLKVLFLICAIVIAALSIPAFFIGFKFTKERYYEPEKKNNTLKHNLGMLFKNKPLLLIVLAGILGGLRIIYMTSGAYFAKYNLGDPGMFAVITILAVPGGLLASVLTPYLSKKFGKKALFIWSHIIGGLALIICFFVGWHTGDGVTPSTGKLIFAAFIIIIAGVPAGFSNILSYSMIADTIDYLEHKTGERAEGICFSMQTFISKIGMALSAFTILITLAICGFDEYANQDPTPQVKQGIWFSSILLAGISMLLTVVPLFFYKFTEKDQARCVQETAELKQRENAEDIVA